MFLLILLIIGLPSNNIADGAYTGICFIIGSAASALSGYIGARGQRCTWAAVPPRRRR